MKTTTVTEKDAETNGATVGTALPKSSDTLGRTLSERYRCPYGVIGFELGDKLFADAGYFGLGRDIVCYGRTSSGNRVASPDAPLYDSLTDVVFDGKKVRLPFDPDEIVDALRFERYASKDPHSAPISLKKFYYRLRPLTNFFVRRQIQRFHARGWQKRTFPRWPVDTSVETICEKLLLLSMEAKGLDSVPFVWFWPNGARGCVVMTHDVETEAGRDFCEELMDLDESFGIKASFQIVPEERYSISADYLASIRRRGFECGIQDLNHDGRLFDNEKEFLRRAEKINRHASDFGAKGFRAGVLYRKPEWLDSLNFSFDMSIPNVGHLDPQRGGCCTVMPYFIGKILELPVTTVQDYTLFHILGERTIDVWKTQLDLILSKNGLANFIVHPDYVINPEVREIYIKLLDYLHNLRNEKSVWAGLPWEVDSWWRARSKMSLESTGHSWRIVGEQAERAVLAFARRADGRLVYEIDGVAVN